MEGKHTKIVEGLCLTCFTKIYTVFLKYDGKWNFYHRIGCNNVHEVK